MSGASGQAAGLAVGAAVGAIGGSIFPGVGTAIGATTGASIGSSVAGFFGEKEAGEAQGALDQASLNLNREQARLKAAETSAIHASNFRSALASQMSVASMRGGSGSIAAQFGQASFGNFLRDQQAIETGLGVSEAAGAISQAGLSAKQSARDLSAITRLAQTSTSAINLSLLASKDKK
jgi:hypothetical protein